MSKWQPASTARRDGSSMLVRLQHMTRSNAFAGAEAVAEVEYTVCKIDEETGDMLDWNGDDMGWKFDEVATHWRDIPYICSNCNGTGAVDAPYSGADPSCPVCGGDGDET